MSPPATAALVVHPHLHPRRTGVTRHVETVVPTLARERELEVTTWGKSLDPSLPRESFASLWRRLRQRGPSIWHAHRNNELLIGLLLRLAQQSLRVVFTRHSATKPGLWTRLLARRANRVLTLDPDSARFFEGDVRVVPHGVDQELDVAVPAGDGAVSDLAHDPAALLQPVAPPGHGGGMRHRILDHALLADRLGAVRLELRLHKRDQVRLRLRQSQRSG